VIENTTLDDFLGGKVQIEQPVKGYRAGIDAVLLAASLDASAGESVLELGAGVGTASLCLNARVKGLRMTSVELQAGYADICKRNAARNQCSMVVETADFTSLPDHIRQKQFDHVIMNPPYFERSKGVSSHDLGRDIAMAGATDLMDWIKIGSKRLAPKGYLTVIQRIERLPDVLNAATERIGSICVRPVSARMGRPAKLFILRARNAGQAPFQMLPPLVMHQGERHKTDAEDYTQQVKGILRDGDKLGWDV